MTDQRHAARGAAILLVAQLAVMASAYLVAVILARSLGPAVYGVYGIVYSCLLSAELIGRLGIPQALSKLLAEAPERERDLAGTATGMSLAIYLGLFVAFWLGAPWLAKMLHVPDGARLFKIAALDIPFYGLFFTVVHVLNGRRDFRREGLVTSAYALVKGAGILVLAAIGPTVEGALIVNALSSALALAIAGGAAGWGVLLPRLAGWRPILRLAVPVAVMSLGFQLLLNVDLWALNMIAGEGRPDELGFYVAASNIARIPNVLAFVLTAILVPTIAHGIATAASDPGDSLRAVGRLVAALLLPACALIAANARDVMTLLFSADYAPGAPLLMLLVLAQGLAFTLLMPLASALMAGGRAGVAATLALGAVAVSLGLNLWLVPVHGALGAATAALVALVLGMMAAATALQRLVAPWLQAEVLLRGLVLTLALVVASLALEAGGIGPFGRAALLALGYLALLPALRLVALDEATAAVGVLWRRPAGRAG